MPKTMVYVSCAESKQIQVFALDAASGTLSLQQEIPIDSAPLPLRVSPNGRFLYAGVRMEHSLQAFVIDPDNGSLSFLNRILAQGAPTYVACDRTGRLLFCASYGDNNLGVFSISEEGKLRQLCAQEDNLPRAHAALVDHTNQWVLVPMLGADAIRVYRLDAEKGDFALVPNDPPVVNTAAGSGPRHPVLAENNRYLYCLNELDGTIDYYHFDARVGKLNIQQTISMMPPGFSDKPWAAELRMSADERFLYATDRRSSTLTAFSIGQESGVLKLIAHYPTQTQPRGMDIDPSSQWLIASGELSNQLTVYAIDGKTGALSAVGSYATGKDPICVEMIALP